MLKKKIITITATLLLSICLFASESATAAYVEGCEFYASGDWTSAKIMLKKAVSYPENFTPAVYYMLITAEVYDGDEKTALEDCNNFLINFPDSSYLPRVKYYKGRSLYDLGEYEKAIIELSDFCHQYVDNELYSYALFYIGESLFAGFKYDEANAIFERIVTEFPESEKAPAAQYRIDTILQHGREEKLLYLLKQTGEEYLSAKEEYEKQLKMYNSDAIQATKQKLVEAQSVNEALEKKVNELELQLEELKKEATRLEAEKAVAEQIAIAKTTPDSPKNVENQQNDAAGNNAGSNKVINNRTPDPDEDIPSLEPYDEMKEQLRILKEKAQEAQKILESKNK